MHLTKTDSALCARFFSFLDEIDNNDTHALYILGDFFEVWVGDDEQTEFHIDVAKRLSSLASNGIAIFIMQGNRDFLLGHAYAQQCGGQLLDDPCTITINSKTIVLSHGDQLCTNDKGYMLYRRIVHTVFLQALFLKLPLSWRRKIARKLRDNSKMHSQRKPEMRMDVDIPSAIKLCQQHQSTLLIHGHTHKPATHQHDDITRIVLAAWHDQGHYLMIDDKLNITSQYF